VKEIKRYLENRTGDFSFYFEDLNEGYSYGYKDKVKMPAAGCIKLPIAIALMREIENEKLKLEINVKVEKTDIEEGGSGIIHEFMEKEYSILELLIAMLIQSDNTAANKIISVLGFERINEMFKEMGLEDTTLKNKTSDKKIDDNEFENCSTSYELSRCFKILNKKCYISEKHSELIIKILSRQQITNKIPFYLPKNMKKNIANKSGALDNIENDTSLLLLPKGDFIFTVMSKSLPSNVYGITTISRIAKMMWDIIDRNWK
jgi:beta-lactamase class A